MTRTATLPPPEADVAGFLRRAVRQEQFLSVVSREEAWARFVAAVGLAPLGEETLPLAAATGRRLARSLRSSVDVPGFDRSNVDGVAVRAADTIGARDGAPVVLALNPEVLACGIAPSEEVVAATATVIATGGMIPRGADAVVMVEHTDITAEAGAARIAVMRPATPGQHITRAGSDIASGETILRKGAQLGAREIGMLAAAGTAEVPVWRRPRVAVLSTGDELVAPGKRLRAGQVYDSNGAILAAAIVENGGEPLDRGIVPDDARALERALAAAIAEADMVILSGGTSKGVGDLSHRVLVKLAGAEVLVHGVALKPGKPLCLAVAGRKPIAVLPGFPTSAMFTFHAFLAPVIRALSGEAEREEAKVEARIGARLPSELGRTEYAMVALAETEAGLAAIPLAKGSGAVTAFSRADGFVEIDALGDGVDAGERVDVTLLDARAAAPDLVIVGSHCVGLDALVERLPDWRVRIVATGSQGGLAALRRGECDLAPIHLLDKASGRYNAPFLPPGAALVTGWRRRQGIVFRRGDARFEGRAPAEGVAAALADAACIMVNRNAGAGTRVLIDDLLGGARPPGFDNQPRSHNAVAAAVAQARADWGVAIDTVAAAYDLGFIPLADEQYDLAVAEARRERPAVRAFLDLLASGEATEILASLDFHRSS
jgi:putative molybdopterin biosynthesis protein